MCLPRVPQEPPGGPYGADHAIGDRIEGWSRYASRRDALGQRHEAPAPPREAARDAAWERVGRSILVEAWPNVPGLYLGPERRAASRAIKVPLRQSALILTARERLIAQAQAQTVARCGESFVALRGFECRDDGDREVRMVVQAHCGLRRCESCDARIREHQASRVEADWKLFFTRTIPHGADAAPAWRAMPRWNRIWYRELRRELAISRRRWPNVGERRADQRAARIQLARSRIRGAGRLRYAWVYEQHRDGWPHVHECLSLEWLDYGWARSVWRKAVRDRRARIDGRRVWATDGVCRYLVKYVSKGGLTADVLAVIHGKRAWASTVRKTSKRLETYFIEQRGNSDDIGAETEYPELVGVAEGWIFDIGKRGRYAKWWRPSAPARTPEVRPADEAMLLDMETYEPATIVERESREGTQHEGWKVALGLLLKGIDAARDGPVDRLTDPR